jgi:hypothetical protein
MTEQLRTYNQNAQPKRIDRFVVSYFELDENIGNVLGNFTKSFPRPTVDLEEHSNYTKGKPNYFHTQPQPNSLEVMFIDDSESVVMDSLYRQLYRQMGRLKGDSRSLQNARFTINIKFFNEQGDCVEEYYLKECFIQNLTGSNFDVTDDGDSTITATIRYDDLEYVFER